MFTRIVNGMSNSIQRRNSMMNDSSSSLHDSWRSDDSLANIIRTRHTPIQLEGQFEQLEDRRQTKYPYNIPNLPKEQELSENPVEHDDDCREDLDSEDGIFDMDF